MNPLRCCPFCGDVGRRTYSNGQYGAFGYIECDLCGTRTKSVKLIEPSRFEREDNFWAQRAWESVERNWNRRNAVITVEKEETA